MSEEWKPNKELIDWARNHFAEMNIGGVWMPEGSGLTYKKEDDKSWTLIQMVDSEESLANHNRMKTLMWDIGISIHDGEYRKLPQPQSEQEAYMMDVQMKRELAQSWADKDGTRLTDMDLENVYPEYVEDKEILLDNGETTSIQIWAFKALNPNTGEYISIDPDDFHLLMGDEAFMRFAYEGEVYTAVTREELVTLADDVDKRESLYILGSRHIQRINEEVKIPPWMWGTVCRCESMPVDEGQMSLDEFTKSEEE